MWVIRGGADLGACLLVFIGGNGGATPRHATLFATDVPPSHATRIIDRFLMYYIRTADKLMRTARWVEQMDGGIEVRLVFVPLLVSDDMANYPPQRLKKILLDDELGICADLEREMDELVGSYYDEWKVVTDDPGRQKQFRQFVNTVRATFLAVYPTHLNACARVYRTNASPPLNLSPNAGNTDQQTGPRQTLQCICVKATSPRQRRRGSGASLRDWRI